MGTLIKHKQHRETLESKCSLQRNMDTNLRKWYQLGASNERVSMNPTEGYLKEGDTMHQLVDDMRIVKKDSIPWNFGL